MTPIRDWMESHGIDPYLAKEIGMWAGQNTLYAPYERADGSTFERYRDFPDGVWKQPAGEPLALWWPEGRAVNAWVILCEGEGDTLAAATAMAGENWPQVLDGLCPVGVPGLGMNPDKIAEELAEADTRVVFIALDGDRSKIKDGKEVGRQGQRATARITTSLSALGIEAIPVWLPEGSDLSDFIQAGPSDAFANLLLDAQAQADDSRKDILMASINQKLGRN